MLTPEQSKHARKLVSKISLEHARYFYRPHGDIKDVTAAEKEFDDYMNSITEKEENAVH